MMRFSRLFVRTRWLNASAGTLLLLLQRTPAIRALLTTESALVAPAVNVLRAALLPAAALGAVHTLAGATTQLVASVSQPAKATVGTPFAEGVTITGAGVSFAQSWSIANTLPPGIVAQGAVLQNGRLVINPSSGTLLFSGTPTTAGTYTIAISGYQFTNFGAPVTNATATIVVSPAPNSAPAVTRQPSNVTAIVGSSATLTVTFTGTPAPTFQWLKNGVALTGATSATLVLNNVTAADAGSYSITLTNSLGATTSAAATLTVNAAPAAPAFTTPPVAQTITAGGDVTLSVVVSGVPTPSLQWLRNGFGIDGATDATLTLTFVQAADAGAYAVTASNSVGTITSAAAVLTVNPAASAPVFTAAPVSQLVGTGSTVVFSSPAIAAPVPVYQWQLNGKAIAGATDATLVVKKATAADAGSYSVVATNTLGTTISNAATLAVSSTPDFGRLSNLSILTDVTAADPFFTVGTVIGGGGTGGAKAILIRAAGPSLTPLGVGGALADPQLNILSGQTVVASNDNWLGTTALSNAFNQVGAFAFTGPTSKDAAVFNPTLASGSYTVQVSGVGGTAGTVIAELYDATAAGTFNAATPRLINVSVLKQIASGTKLTAGFVIGGTTARTVLVRAVGPALGLAPFNVPGAMADPKLELFSGQDVIASNDNWGGDAPLAAAGTAVGAFAIANPASKDAILLLTLAPGPYTVQVGGVGGGGTALVEVYEVP